MDATDWLEAFVRLLVVVGLVAGAWESWRKWRKAPPPVKIAGKRYYRHPKGGHCTIWGRRVQDPELARRIEEAAAAKASG